RHGTPRRTPHLRPPRRPNDLVTGLLRPDIDPQLLATMNLLFDREIDEIAARIRRGEAG
ncbi:hypothetical protein GT354_15540, partial [Streptomyces sp. SID3343]|nr:hypothetical protein [Streptomyces sp. SID3343]